MANTRPRRRSMTDAFFFTRNPAMARNDLINAVEEMRQHSSRRDEFVNSLPKLSERDLASLGESDSTCPICITSLLDILSEEETAIAMDSPAHPIEELGVTRLVQTCGHIFCRKDIRGWLFQGNTTCPTCRTPFMAPLPAGPNAILSSAANADEDIVPMGLTLDGAPVALTALLEDDTVSRAFRILGSLEPSGRGPQSSDGRWQDGDRSASGRDDEHDEHESFSAMYS